MTAIATVRVHLRPVLTEWFLAVSFATAVAFLFQGDFLLARLDKPVVLAVIFTWLFAVILGSALRVVHHADELAEALGEPYGTLVLTLSITFIEVMSISAVMVHGANNPTLTRDTLLAVVMIILNGMVGLSLLLGGWRHSEQDYNLRGANAYLGVIMPLVVLSLILPDFTQTTPGPTLSFAQQMFLVMVSVGLYLAFLGIQTGRHRSYFTEEATSAGYTKEIASIAPNAPSRHGWSTAWHAVLLLAYLAPIVFLAEQFAHPVDYLIETLQAPAALGGLIVAVLVATPEAIGAVRAAMANHMQRSINIFLGSVLSTIGLTVPAMMLISHFTHRSIILGVEHAGSVLVLLTLAVSIVTFASGRTNAIQGAVHLTLFAAYLLLIVQG